MHFGLKIMIQGFFLGVFIIGCKSNKISKEDEKEGTPFSITKATYQNWYGGIQDEKGTIIVITGKDLRTDVVLKTLYYKGKKSNIIPKFKRENFVLKIDINTSKRDRNFVMDGDTQKEYGNKPPVKKKYPNLKENEALISFIESNREYEFLVKLTKEKDLFYP